MSTGRATYGPLCALMAVLALAITAPPVTAATDLDRGRTAALRGDWDSALGFFEQAFAASPDDPEVLHAVATAHEWLRHPVPAIAFYRAYLERQQHAKDRDQVESRIVEQEVFLDRLTRDLFREAIAAANTVEERAAAARKEQPADDVTVLLRGTPASPPPVDHGPWPALARHLAEAGQAALLQEVAMLHPAGVPEVLALAALNATREFHHTSRVLDAADPVHLLDQAETILAADAERVGSQPTPDAAGLQSYFMYGCYVDTQIAACVEEMRRKYPREAAQRQAYHLGIGRLSLAYFASQVGLRARAYRLWEAGLRDLRGNVVFRRRGCYAWSGLQCIAGSADQAALLDRDGRVTFPADAVDDPPRIRAMRSTRWIDLVRTGQAEFGFPTAFDLTDPAYRHPRTSVEAAQKRQPVEAIPLALAELAGKLARARLFFRLNDPTRDHR